MGEGDHAALENVFRTVFRQKKYFYIFDSDPSGWTFAYSRLNHFHLYFLYLNQNQVEIGVVQVEFTHSNKTNILRIMDAAGYDNPFNLLEDLIFVKRGKQFK